MVAGQNQAQAGFLPARKPLAWARGLVRGEGGGSDLHGDLGQGPRSSWISEVTEFTGRSLRLSTLFLGVGSEGSQKDTLAFLRHPVPFQNPFGSEIAGLWLLSLPASL